MPRLIEKPTKIDCVGTKPKQIQEFAGHVNSGHTSVSVARMISPSGWEEPGQRPEFEEITVVLKGTLRVQHEGGALDVHAGQAVVTSPASGFATARRGPREPNTSRCACRRFRRQRSTATRRDGRFADRPYLGSTT